MNNIEKLYIIYSDFVERIDNTENSGVEEIDEIEGLIVPHIRLILKKLEKELEKYDR